MKLVVHGAQLQCDQGTSTAMLTVLPTNQAFAGMAPVATIQDFAPFTNIASFGLCKSLANPVVAAATAAHLGVLTPMPCAPKTTAPWTPGSPFFNLNGLPALMDTSKCMCQWRGIIGVADPKQTFATLEQGAGMSAPPPRTKAVDDPKAAARPKAGASERVAVPPSVKRPQGHHIVHHFACESTGRPVAGVAWHLFDAKGTKIAEGVTGQDGFVVAEVPAPGKYSLEFQHEPEFQEDPSWEFQGEFEE